MYHRRRKVLNIGGQDSEYEGVGGGQGGKGGGQTFRLL